MENENDNRNVIFTLKSNVLHCRGKTEEDKTKSQLFLCNVLLLPHVTDVLNYLFFTALN